ncbi:MAG: M23 family metallopeptidase [Leptolyngbyaceae cyanobacterium bins.302]|nr:M23 family metallopeptidase [Leptolyngbyaceae cyanobacterium bins.302]
MKPLEAFTLGLSGYLLSLAIHAPVSDAITPEQAINAYERQLERDLFSTPNSSLKTQPSSLPHPSPHPITPNTPAPSATYIQPTKGTLTSGYGWRWGRMHKGIDIAGAIGTPIVASADGEVIFSGWNTGGYGYLVEIRHSDGSITRYAHNSKLLVNSEDFVKQGQAIALMGSTGYSTGSHLHFEIILRQKGHVNPMAFLPKKLAAR